MKNIQKTKNVTKSDEILDYYFNDIKKIKLLKDGEEIELAKKIKNGDKKAEEKLIKSNLRFVVTVAKQYQNQGLSLQDLIAEGNIGLIKSAKKFDETKNIKFISYAVWWIRQSIIESITNTSKSVRLPLNKVHLKSKINKSIKKLTNELGREPSLNELSLELDLKEQFILDAMNSTNNQSYLNDPFKSNDGENGSLLDVIENVNSDNALSNLNQESLKKDINYYLNFLNKEEKDILEKSFGIGYPYPMSCEDISEEINRGSERIRQIKDKALRRLKFIGKEMNQHL